MNVSINDGLVFVLSFGVVISLLIGVSYNGSNATSSLEEREKIPLYYVSTRDILNITYEEGLQIFIMLWVFTISLRINLITNVAYGSRLF